MKEVTAIEDATGLHYDGLRITVHSSPASHLHWLEEFLTPAFERGPCPVGDWRVVVTEDATRYAAIVRQGPCLGAAPVACFALDHDFVRLPLWNGSNGMRTVVDEPSRVAYEVDPCGRRVSLITPPENLAVRTALMRVVRELAMRHAQHKGGLLLHAAALAVGDRGLILAGAKDAGKTTLLINLLRHGTTRYVSNDRVLVSQALSPARLHGMPTIISIRPGTLELFPRLRQQLLASTFHYRLSMEETVRAARRPARPWSDGRFGVSPAQFCALLGVEPSASCQLSALVFPQIAGDERGICLREISVTEASDRLTRALFGSAALSCDEPLLAAADETWVSDTTALAARMEQLAAAVPRFECRLGRRAYESAHDATEIASRLVG